MAGGLVQGARRPDQKGMTTAEYAVGTVASVSIVGILIAIIQNPEFQNALWRIVLAIIKAVMQAMGAG